LDFDTIGVGGSNPESRLIGLATITLLAEEQVPERDMSGSAPQR
jgi:hypothetical protein